MRFSGIIPLRHKLKLVIILTSGISLILACAALLFYESRTFRENLRNELLITAQILGNASTPAILFDDSIAAGEILASLRADPQIMGAAVFDAAGDRLAFYLRDEDSPHIPPVPPNPEMREYRSYLPMIVPIIEERSGEEVGTFFLLADFQRMRDRMQVYTYVLGTAFLGALGVAFFLSVYFERLVTRPIQRLAETAQTVSREKDYSVRATGHTPDELGVLIDAFNQMLDEIHEQDLALRESRDRLERRVAERTRELELGRQELERSNADLEQFAYVASHDLQEPLRMVSSFTQLLERRYGEALDSDGRKFVQFAGSGARRMQALLDALLEYSRVGTGGRNFVEMDVSTVLDDALANLGKALEESEGIVTRGPLPRIVADRTQLIQLFQNLIGNAIKFHRKDVPPRVHVSAVRDATDWRFCVEDNGLGIDRKHLDRIFIIFQRLESENEYPGTGIGLGVCKKIVERHQGRIWADSEPGKGTKVFFVIPDNLDKDIPNYDEPDSNTTDPEP